MLSESRAFESSYCETYFHLKIGFADFELIVQV